MVVSDFRSRTVEVWALAVTFVIIAAVSVVDSGFRVTLENMAGNILALIPVGLCVMLYLKARGIRFRDAVGEGDILFILAVTPLFTVKGFLVFMTVSSLASLVVWYLYASLSSVRSAYIGMSIPLISGLGICLSIHLAATAFGIYRITNLDCLL